MCTWSGGYPGTGYVTSGLHITKWSLLSHVSIISAISLVSMSIMSVLLITVVAHRPPTMNVLGLISLCGVGSLPTYGIKKNLKVRVIPELDLLYCNLLK